MTDKPPGSVHLQACDAAKEEERQSGMPAITAGVSELEKTWAIIFEGPHLKSPRFTMLAREMQRSISDLTLTLGPGPAGRQRSLHDLSEGQSSLFYIALEEPENHLYPFYLSRMIGLMKDLTDEPDVIDIMTTHSASALRRLEPRQIRHRHDSVMEYGLTIWCRS